MIIPKAYGGLGFSATAHSEVVRKISSRSVSAAVTAMVPNSLGPGELLLQFGTKEQQDYWLPRLADGRELPCFGLTSPEAGSDAASMVDVGVVCRGIVARAGCSRHPAQLAQALYHAGACGDRAGSRIQAAGSRSLAGPRNRYRDHACARADRIFLVWKSGGVICRRCMCSRTAPISAATCSFRWIM